MGDSFLTLHICFWWGTSTISQAVYDVCDAIWEVMHPVYMKPPTKEDWKQIEHLFQTRWNFPNCIGSIDGKHVMMRAPPNSNSLFFNCKNLFSIILMALVDADNRFIFIEVGHYGSNGGSRIFRTCPLGQAFMQGNLKIPWPKRLPGWPQGGGLSHCIVGDEAFPVRMDLMQPSPKGKKENRLPYNKMIFNYRLSRARRIVENSFGILVQRFRVYDKRICMDNHNVVKVVKATCILHNYLCTARMDAANVMAQLNPQGAACMWSHAMLHELGNQGYNGSTAAEWVWNIYMEYFNSNIGAVPWQAIKKQHH